MSEETTSPEAESKALEIQLEEAEAKVASLKRHLQLNETKAIINHINEHRTKILEDFTKAWLAANAPEGFDFGWLMRNVLLCERTVYEDGKRIDQTWIELVKPK